MTDVIEQPIIDGDEFPDAGSIPDVEPGTETQEIVESPEAISADHLAPVRDLIALAHQDIVPELLAGDTLEALLASVPAARESYQRLEARFQQQQERAPRQIPQPSPVAINLNAMSTDKLLRQGMIERRDRSVSRQWPKTRA